MDTTVQRVDISVWNNALLYSDYRNLVEVLLKEGKITSGESTDKMLAYTKLNVQRMNRVDKTFVPEESTKNIVNEIKKPVKWLVLSEGWCGDAAQTIPVLVKLASLSSYISLKIAFRDKNLNLMDEHLTNGTRSIPKLLVLDENFNVVDSWGPRPGEAQKMVLDFKAKGLPHDEWIEKVHVWYAKNKGKAVESEILNLIKNLF